MGGAKLKCLRDVSLAVFGSCARGDADSASDKDLLVLHDNPIGRGAICQHFRSSGWECSDWSWAAFERQAHFGSLFVHHIATEGVIVHDASGRLADILSSYKFRSQYSREQQDAEAVLALLSDIPCSKNGVQWAFDILMTGFRTWAVPFLAEAGMPSYGHSDIVLGLSRIRHLDSHAMSALMELRLQKGLYRGRPVGIAAPKKRLWDCARAVGAALKFDVPCQLVNPAAAVVSASRIRKMQTSGYIKSRLVERSLIGYGDEVVIAKIGHVADELQRQIASPRCYARGFDATTSRSIRLYEQLTDIINSGNIGPTDPNVDATY